jgi:hypothetical protein
VANKSQGSIFKLLLWYVPERILRVPTYFFMTIHGFFLKRVVAIAMGREK